MSTFSEAIRDRLFQTMARHRLALIKDQEGLIEPGGPKTIASRLPFVRLVGESGGFTGRRKRIRIGNGAGLIVRARLRPAPPEPDGGWTSVLHGFDYRNRRLPLCCVDEGTPRIHVLVDLRTMEPLETAGEVDPVPFLVASLFDGPIESMIRKDTGAVWVGPEVGKGVRQFMGVRSWRHRHLLEREKWLLEQHTMIEGLPAALKRRLAQLKQALAKTEETDEENGGESVEREVSRLRRLIASRVLGAIQFSDRSITGLVNPRRVAEGWGLRPLMFRLGFDRAGYRPCLFVWNPSGQSGGDVGPQCMGEGDCFLREFIEGRDVYCMLDLILNFLETNAIGAVPLDGNTPRRSLRAYLAAML
jgi:hypothetical protein